MKVKIAKIKNIVYEKDNYINTNYTGLAKFIYYFNHKLLEFGFSKKIYNKHIIEIGGGAQPHIHYMNLDPLFLRRLMLGLLLLIDYQLNHMISRFSSPSIQIANHL